MKKSINKVLADCKNCVDWEGCEDAIAGNNCEAFVLNKKEKDHRVRVKQAVCGDCSRYEACRVMYDVPATKGRLCKSFEPFRPRKIKVTQDKEDIIPTEIIAKSIVKIAESVKMMKSSGLTERAVVLLIQDASGENKSTVLNILRSLETLEQLYQIVRKAPCFSYGDIRTTI